MRGLSGLYKGLSGVVPTADDLGAVQRAGDTMTGALILSGSPTDPNQAATKSYVDSNLNAKQDTLVSGTNIKTINSSSILGSGNLSIFTPPTIQKYTSGSGTYTKPAGVLYLKIKMVGGGGGGGGSGAGGGNGSTGGNSTFGTSLLSANGGTGGVPNGALGGVGGGASLGTGPIGTALSGGYGQAGFTSSAVGSSPCGGFGGTTAFGGAGSGGNGNGGGAGASAISNTGAGGGGGGGSATTTFAGAGGGAGGYVDAIITSPSSTYSYVVGAAGTAGTAGASGFAGGAGGSGYIEVTEYYN